MGNFGGVTKPCGELKVTAAEQAEHEAALFAKRTTDIPNNMQIQLDYGGRSDNQPVYQGFGARGLADASAGWLIYKFTYTADPGDMTKRQTAYTSWNLRADGGTTYA